MTHIFKIDRLNKLHQIRNLGWRLLLGCVALFGFLALPMVANAQATGCLANETAQTISFASPNWTAGSGGPIVYNGVTANVGNATATVSANLTNIVTGNPVTQQSGGFADAFYYLINRPAAAGSNVFTITFSKPVRNLNITATDIDTIDVGGGGVDGGKYQDAVTFTGSGPSGAVVPTATSGALVTVVGNTATAVSTGTTATNCAADSALCNAVFNYAAPITSLSMAYFNGPLAAGDPPAHVVGVANIGFCVQNPNLSLVKDDAAASFAAGSTGTYSFVVSNAGSAATSGTTTVKDILPAGMSFGTPLTPGGANAAAWTCAVSTTTNTNDTATCTSTTAIAAAGASSFTLPVDVAAGTTGTLTNRAKVYGGGDPNKAAETTTGTIASCAADGLAGGAAGAGCGFETTPVKTITLTLQKAWSGATINDAVTVSATGLTSLFAVANTATETDVGIAQSVLLGNKTLTEAFTTGNSANYTSTLACAGNSNALVGNVLTVAVADTAIVCTFTNTRNVANLVVTKNDTKTTTVSGDTNTYSITVTNNGPLAANNTLVTDPAVTGLTCSTVNCAAAGGAVCPASPTVAALQSPGLTIPTLPNAGSVTLTLTCSVSATGV